MMVILNLIIQSILSIIFVSVPLYFDSSITNSKNSEVGRLQIFRFTFSALIYSIGGCCGLFTFFMNINCSGIIITKLVDEERSLDNDLLIIYNSHGGSAGIKQQIDSFKVQNNSPSATGSTDSKSKSPSSSSTPLAFVTEQNLLDLFDAEEDDEDKNDITQCSFKPSMEPKEIELDSGRSFRITADSQQLLDE